jgi:K(+)-stimulated pyrophosphate-energized sodium pump
MNAINRSFFMSAVISAVLVGFATYTYLPSSLKNMTGLGVEAQSADVNPRILALGAVLIGIGLAAAIPRSNWLLY